MKNINERIDALLDKGHEETLVSLIEKLEAVVEMPDALVAKLEALGDTPIDEPDVFKAIEESAEKGSFAIAEAVLGDNIDDYDAIALGTFIWEVRKKITSLKKEDGSFKSTPDTKECDLPNFREAEQLLNLGRKEDDIRKKFIATPDSDSKKKKKLKEEYKQISKEIEDLTFKISGLSNIDDLTEWEKSLVGANIFGACMNARLASMGKPLRS